MSNRSEKQLEKYELPKTVDGICSLVREVLEGGNVDRMEIDNDDAYVRAWRWVEKGDLEEPDISWDAALRNVETMLEYASEGASSYQTLVDMMLLAHDEKMYCNTWAVGRGGKKLIHKWLELRDRGMPIPSVDSLLGLPVKELKSLPEETIILCCSKYPRPDPGEITMAVKAVIELRSSNAQPVHQDAHRGGNHSGEHSPATSSLGLGGRGLRQVAWK